MHIRQRVCFVKSRDKEMLLFTYAASGPLHYSLHMIHRTCVILQVFCGLTAKCFGGQEHMQDFSGGANFKKFGILVMLLGGFGGMTPKNFFLNGAISCVLRAIYNHFHDKKNPLKNYK